VHQVGDQPRLYYDARSTNHKDQTLCLLEQGIEDPWLFFEVKRGPRANVFGKHSASKWADTVWRQGSVKFHQTQYPVLATSASVPRSVQRPDRCEIHVL